MVKITFTVHDEMGLHARPAGELVKEAVKCSSEVTIRKGERQETQNVFLMSCLRTSKEMKK